MRVALIVAAATTDLSSFPALGPAYLAAYIRENMPGVKVDIFQDLQTLCAAKPDLVGISCVSQNFDIACKFARAIKTKIGAKVVLGGPHITCLPKSLPDAADAGVIGEGERTFCELIAAWNGADVDLSQIKGICYHLENGVQITAQRSQVNPLDKLPLPALDGLFVHNQRAHLVTGRGCPYRCSFCSAKTIWGDLRLFSAKRIMAEVVRLSENFDVREIHFYDDLFVADKKRLAVFSDLFHASDLHRRMSFSCSVRANLVDDDLCELLMRTNIHQVNFGAETQDATILRDVKPDVDDDGNRRALDTLARHQIDAFVSMIVGFPGQSAESMRGTFRFLAQQVFAGNICGADINILAPFPGTPYFEQAKSMGLVGADFDWSAMGRPWHGLLLNSDLPDVAGELIGYDAKIREILDAVNTDCVAVVNEPACEKDLLQAASLWGFSAVYGQAKTTQVLHRGKTDIALLSSEDMGKTLQTLGDLPVIVFPSVNHIRKSDVRCALAIFFANSNSSLIFENRIRICACKDFVKGNLDRIENEPTTPFVLPNDPLCLLESEISEKKDFVQLFDEHANRILKKQERAD
jgi:pyruvate-formate lyase-activating enzyme